MRHPDQWELLRGAPELLADAVEELLRYDPPVQFANRVAAVDLEIGGHTFRKGERVMLLIAAANRDPAQFPEPDRLDVRREELRHQSFGIGALLRGRGAGAAWRRRRPSPRCCAASHKCRWRLGVLPEWADNVGFRGLQSLPVVLGPAA